MRAPGGAWPVHHDVGTAAELHARALDEPLGRAVRVRAVSGPALVLGSAQRGEALVDEVACTAAGVAVVRRRSGGGAVLLEPGQVVWVDVEVPRDDPRWDDDIGRATWWLGERWGIALAGLGVEAPTVHRGALQRTRWSDLVCFAGLGPGELTAGAGGPKVLGISQRRTRAGARFQCAVPLSWAPSRIAGLLALDEADREQLADDLRDVVRPVAATPPEVVTAFVAVLAADSV